MLASPARSQQAFRLPVLRNRDRAMPLRFVLPQPRCEMPDLLWVGLDSNHPGSSGDFSGVRFRPPGSLRCFLARNRTNGLWHSLSLPLTIGSMKHGRALWDEQVEAFEFESNQERARDFHSPETEEEEMSEKPGYLKLADNQPVTVALKYQTPREVTGAWGPQLLWILTGNRALYTPLHVKADVEKLNIRAGQKFTIEKRQANGKTGWVVSLAQPVAALLNGQESLDNPIPENPRPSTMLESALKTAVSAAAAAEKHATEIGYTVRFTPSDIRAMGISVLIGMESRHAA
jgi:hypothetical protein